jgi:hypothetical protein
MHLSEQRKVTFIQTAVAMLFATSIKKFTGYAWKKLRRQDIPEDPHSPDTPIRDALMYTILTGLIVGVTNLITKRMAVEGYNRLKS